MIVCHSRKFIFIKTVKTAGTSLEMALSKLCGAEDIITPLIPDEEAQRRQIAGIGGQRYLKTLGAMSRKEQARFLLRGKRPPVFEEHSAAWDVRAKLGETIWSEYFTFSVVRHPYDRLVSRFFYTRFYETGRGRRDFWDQWDFDQFLRYRTELITENWKLLTVRDELQVDFVVHFEALEADLAEVSRRIGVPSNIYDDMKSIRAKGDIRPKSAEEKQVLNEKQRTLIAMLCEKEFEAFGYAA